MNHVIACDSCALERLVFSRYKKESKQFGLLAF